VRLSAVSTDAFAHSLAGGDQLDARSLGERLHAGRVQQLVGRTELGTRIDSAVLAAQPLAVEQWCAGELRAKSRHGRQRSIASRGMSFRPSRPTQSRRASDLNSHGPAVPAAVVASVKRPRASAASCVFRGGRRPRSARVAPRRRETTRVSLRSPAGLRRALAHTGRARVGGSRLSTVRTGPDSLAAGGGVSRS